MDNQEAEEEDEKIHFQFRHELDEIFKESR